MKKVLISVLILLFITLMLTACSQGEKKAALTVGEFRQKAESAGYQVEDMEITPEDKEVEPGLTICLAFYKDIDEGYFHTGHFKVFDTVKNGEEFYTLGKNDLEGMERMVKQEGNEVFCSSLEDQNFSYYARGFSSLDEPFYAAILQMGKTVIDVTASIETQAEMEQFLRDLGYME